MSLHKSNTLEAINNSPLNTSKSKAMFSFTKANRFIELKQPNSSFYDQHSSISKRATSFGYGTKSELVNKYMKTPSPDKYSKVSEFDPIHKRGISIGLGRDDCKNVSIFRQTKYPAPTDYNCKENKQNSAAYSIRPKVKLPELFPQKKTPGPGQYDNQKIQKQNGSSFISKFKSSISFKIPSQSPRSIEKITCPNLSPLSYNTVVSSNGKQILSKKKTEKSFYFAKKPRVTLNVDSGSPGPGAYSFFSQFNR